MNSKKGEHHILELVHMYGRVSPGMGQPDDPNPHKKAIPLLPRQTFDEGPVLQIHLHKDQPLNGCRLDLGASNGARRNLWSMSSGGFDSSECNNTNDSS